MRSDRLKKIEILILIMAAALAVVSAFGGFAENAYAREVESLAVQGIGQDRFDLFAVVPLLLAGLLMLRRNTLKALIVLEGTVGYVLYSFVIYAFGIHFNQMFLLYCLILGLALFTFILIFRELQSAHAAAALPGSRAVAVFFLAVSLMFYLLWFKEVIPAIVNNTTPQSVREYRLPVNPVHVLDIAIVLPALILTAFGLFRGTETGKVMAPVFLIFIVQMALALIAMVIMLKTRGLSEDLSVAVIFTAMTVISVVLLIRIFRGLRRS